MDSHHLKQDRCGRCGGHVVVNSDSPEVKSIVDQVVKIVDIMHHFVWMDKYGDKKKYVVKSLDLNAVWSSPSIRSFNQMWSYETINYGHTYKLSREIGDGTQDDVMSKLSEKLKTFITRYPPTTLECADKVLKLQLNANPSSKYMTIEIIGNKLVIEEHDDGLGM